MSCNVQGGGRRRTGRVSGRCRVRGWRGWATTRDSRCGRSSAIMLPSSSPSLPGHNKLLEREKIDEDNNPNPHPTPGHTRGLDDDGRAVVCHVQ